MFLKVLRRGDQQGKTRRGGNATIAVCLSGQGGESAFPEAIV